jgi:hypothetical protein
VRGDSLRLSRDTLYPLKLALTSPTSGGRSVGIVRWRTTAPEFLVGSVDILEYRVASMSYPFRSNFMAKLIWIQENPAADLRSLCDAIV